MRPLDEKTQIVRQICDALDEIGWTLLAPGDPADWDGLLPWFLNFISEHPEHLSENYLESWRSAAGRVKKTA